MFKRDPNAFNLWTLNIEHCISKFLQTAFLVFWSILSAGALFADELTIYPALPNNQYCSDLYEVTVSQAGKNQSSYVYKSRRDANDPYPYEKYHLFVTDANHWTSFSFSGKVTVQVKLRDRSDLRKVTVRPLSQQIHATVIGNTVSLTLKNPANIYVEIGSKARDPLFIFANPPEVDIPTAATPNVIYFGPGMTDLGTTPRSVAGGQTVYLAGGAYVKGRLATAKENGSGPVTIRGRGILSGIDITKKRNTWAQHMIDAYFQRPAPVLDVEGIVITDSPGPCIFASKRLQAVNVKLLAWTRCSDGIGGGPNSLVKGCFLKVNDDSISLLSGLKALKTQLIVGVTFMNIGWLLSKSL